MISESSSPEARSPVGRNELVTFHRLFLCLSFFPSSPPLLFFSYLRCISSTWEAIHPSIEKRPSASPRPSACAQVLPIGGVGTFDRPRKTLIKKALNGGRDRRRVYSSRPEDGQEQKQEKQLLCRCRSA